MKRIILLCVSLALICSCFVVSGSQNHVKVGAGFGIGEQVKEPEELVSLMEFITGEDFGGLLSSDNDDFKTVTLSGNSDYDSVEDMFADNDDILGSFTDRETSEETDEETSNDDENNSETADGEDEDENESESETKKKSKKKYKSTTVRVDTSVDYSFSSTNTKLSSGLRNSKQTATRSMTMYVTEDATFYSTRGQSSGNAVREKKDKEGYSRTVYENSTAIFDIDILNTKKTAYFYFREFSFTNNYESMQIKKEYREKWIEMPQSIVYDIVSVDSSNRTGFESIGKLIDLLESQGKFKTNDRVVKVDEDDLNTMYKKEYDTEKDFIEDGTVYFEINLSDASAPKIDFSSEIEDEEKYDYSDEGYYDIYGNYHSSSRSEYNGTTTTKIKASETITFLNINNTKISFNKDKVEIVMDTEDDTEVMFLIEEKERDDE